MSRLCKILDGGHARGFTLIELMTVVLMLAILVAIAVPSYNTFVLRGRTAEAALQLQTLVNLELSWLDKPRMDGVTGLELYSCWVTSSNRRPTVVGASLISRASPWGPPNSPPDAFDIIGFAPTNNVYYSYTLDAQTNTGIFVIQNSADGYCRDGVGAGNADMTTEPLRVRAIGDLDGDGTSPVEGVDFAKIARFARIITTAAGVATTGPLVSENPYE